MPAYDPKTVLGYGPGDNVRFIGATDDQINFSGGADPRTFLTVGKSYSVSNVKVGGWSSRVSLACLPGLWFNSVCFELETEVVSDKSLLLDGFEPEEYVVHNIDSGKEYSYEKASDALKAYKERKEDYPGWRLRVNLKEKEPE